MRAFRCAIMVAASCVVLAFAWLTLAMDYGDSVIAGTYHFSDQHEASTLTLKRDHTFLQQLAAKGMTLQARGTWRKVGEGGVSFSKEFMTISGEEQEPDGTAFADMKKALGLFPSLHFRQYHVLWYGRSASSADNTLIGVYTGDEPNVAATIELKTDNTFEQTINLPSGKREANGTWSIAPNGDVVFSRRLLKTSGEPLTAEETATSMSGANLQIEISKASGSAEPVFRKRYLVR